MTYLTKDVFKWSLFGFHVETEPPEDDDQVFCNGSIFALIFVLYFGYVSINYIKSSQKLFFFKLHSSSWLQNV